MKYIRNIENLSPKLLNEMLGLRPGRIASKALVDTENIDLRFFSFSKGEDIDKEYYPMDSLVIVIEGSLKIHYDMDEKTQEITCPQGSITGIEAGVNYGFEAMEDLKLFLIMLKD